MAIEYFEESPMFTHSGMLTGAKTASSWEVRQVDINWENFQKNIEDKGGVQKKLLFKGKVQNKKK